jgi:hypothetical protein
VLCEELFPRVLCRLPTEKEKALINSREFLFNH